MPRVVAGYKEQARARIVEGASTVFHRKGFRSATMEDIAREIGVSKGALYLYFRTKSELLVEIQARSRSVVLRSWEGLLESGDVAEGLTSSIDSIFSGEVDPGVWHELAAESASDPTVRAALDLDHREDRRLLRGFLRKLESRGRIPKMEDPETVVDIILALFEASFLEIVLWGHAPAARNRLIRELRLVLRL